MDAQKPPPRLWRNEKWQQCYLHFIANIASSKTRYQYNCTLRRFFLFVAEKHGKPRTPDQISSTDIEEFLQQPCRTPGARHGKPISPCTRNSYIMALRSFYAYCGHAETEFRGKMVPLYRKEPPTEHIKLALLGEVARDFTEDELWAFFAAIDRNSAIGKRDFCLFWTLFATGRRRMEITNLLRGDIEPYPFVENGQKREGWRFHFRAKRRVSREAAELPPRCLTAIKEFHQAVGLDFDTMEPDHPIFFGLSGPADRTKPLNLNTVDRRFRKYATIAGIAENIVTHSLRWENSWQRYCESGNDILAVQEALGWRSVTQAVHYIRRRKRQQVGDPIASRLEAKFAKL